MVNLVRADLDYVKDVIKADWERDVFPPNSADMTEEQRRGGYRTWTDRKGEQLAAKFVRRASADLILSFDDEEHTFPFHAVSQGDQQWVGDELKRRSDAARAAADARAATAPAPNPSPSSPSFPGGTPYGNDIGGRSGIYNWYGDGIVPVRIPV